MTEATIQHRILCAQLGHRLWARARHVAQPQPKRRSVQEAGKAIGGSHSTLALRDVLTIRRRWQDVLGASALAIVHATRKRRVGTLTRFCEREAARLARCGRVVSPETIEAVVRRDSWGWVPQP